MVQEENTKQKSLVEVSYSTKKGLKENEYWLITMEEVICFEPGHGLPGSHCPFTNSHGKDTEWWDLLVQNQTGSLELYRQVHQWKDTRAQSQQCFLEFRSYWRIL